MKIIRKTFIISMVLLILLISPVYASRGNISGYNDKNSDKIIFYDGKYYGYHN